jgi:diketogulonate reductase-like aldo/keto reductase
MICKILGNTNVRLPEVGLGTWNYKGGVEPLRRGIALGARLIDTAESYGTEGIVGEAVKGMRQSVFLATKALPRNFRHQDLLLAADRSLQRLRTHYIDLYQLHWPNYTVPIEETMAAMERLVELGKIRFIGVSNFSVSELRKGQAALSKNRIVSNQVRYNLVERSIERRVLPYCQQNQITVIAFSPLATGFYNIKRRDPRSVLGDVGAQVHRTEAQLALNWCLRHDSLIVIPKAASEAHVAENCGASGWQLSAEQIKHLGLNIGFRRRGGLELFLRRTARHVLQRFGYNL